jgi:hypothetical protein
MLHLNPNKCFSSFIVSTSVVRDRKDNFMDVMIGKGSEQQKQDLQRYSSSDNKRWVDGFFFIHKIYMDFVVMVEIYSATTYLTRLQLFNILITEHILCSSFVFVFSHCKNPKNE